MHLCTVKTVIWQICSNRPGKKVPQSARLSAVGGSNRYLGNAQIEVTLTSKVLPLFDKWAQKKCTMLQYRYLYPLTPHVPCKNMERKNCSKEFFNWSDPPPPPTSFQSTNCESSPWPVPFNIVDIPDTQQEFQIPKLSKNFEFQNSARISNPKTQQEF